MKNIRLRPILIILLLVVLTGGIFVFAGEKAEAKKEQQQAVQPRPQYMGIGALGMIEPRSRVLKISHNAGPEGAKIERLLVDENQDVQENQILALLADNARKKAEFAAAEAFITSLQSRLKIEEVNLAFAEKEYNRRIALAKAKAISEAELEKGTQAFEQAKLTQDDLKAQIANAEAQLLVARENLANTEIRAPIGGTVLRIISRSGERLESAGLLEMADLTQMDVVAEVYERDIPMIKTGQRAVITITGSDAVYHGTVREIGFEVRGNDLNDTDPLADKDNRVVPVRITLDEDALKALRHQIYRLVQVSITR